VGVKGVKVSVIIDILQCVVTECIDSGDVVVVDLVRLRVRVRARVWVTVRCKSQCNH